MGLVVDHEDALGHGASWTLESHTQSWRLKDAATSLDLDQEGSITYTAEGGEGSVTFHFEGGGSETCAVSVTWEGSTTLSGCSLAD